MDLGGRKEFVVQHIVEAAVFEASSVGLAFPCLSRISANGRYAYNTTTGQRILL